MAAPGLDLFSVRQYEPATDAEGKRYFTFGASLSLDMSRDFADAVFAVLEDSRLSQYDGVYLEIGGDLRDELEWFPAGVLKSLASHPQVASSQANRAAWAYLAALDDDEPVGMYWAY